MSYYNTLADGNSIGTHSVITPHNRKSDGIFRNDNVNTGIINNVSDTIAPNHIPPDIKIKQNKIIVNSLDRNWYNYRNETPYKYLVKLGGSPTDKYLTVSNNYKNIISFSVEKIILPNRPAVVSYNSNISPRLNDNPYLAVVIKGLNYSGYGTNRLLNETIGIYTPIIPIPVSISNVSYMEFKNTSLQRKEYVPTLEGSISVLDLTINNPLGFQASNLNDVLDIYSIFLNTSNTALLSTNDTLTIQTSTFFYPTEFQNNDLVRIKNYEYHNMSFDESGIFNNWINRDSGHYISSISKSNSLTELYNQINIPIPADLSTSTGILNIMTWFNSFIMKTFSNVAVQDNGGKLINVNLQTHLIVNINTVDKNDNLFLKDL
jgi:hypothetical protein